MKYKPARNPYSLREKEVLTGKDGIYCPFCDPPHKLIAGSGNQCGTTVRITAVQLVIPARLVREKEFICLKCGKGEGAMVMLRSGQYVHEVDCAPGTKIVTTPPNFSAWAKYVLKLPEKLRAPIEKRFGKASMLKEINEQGAETGKIIGYFFWKDDANGTTSTATA